VSFEFPSLSWPFFLFTKKIIGNVSTYIHTYICTYVVKHNQKRTYKVSWESSSSPTIWGTFGGVLQYRKYTLNINYFITWSFLLHFAKNIWCLRSDNTKSDANSVSINTVCQCDHSIASRGVGSMCIHTYVCSYA